MPQEQLQKMLAGKTPVLALAPMQDVTTLEFWRLLAGYGGADVYVTEYFRVHSVSKPDRDLLKLITENPTGRPVIAQLIGNDIPALVRTAKKLQQYPIAAIDFNLGCPAPIVCSKYAGGGLLRDPEKTDAVLGALREAVKVKFTVKTRLGYASPKEFDGLLPIYAKHSLDMLTVHGRTVGQVLGGTVDYARIAEAVRVMPCPVLANGNVSTAANAIEVLEFTKAHGLMIGRGAIRNPWLFDQIRQKLGGKKLFIPSGYDVLKYIRALYAAIGLPECPEKLHVQVMKKYLNFLGEGVDAAFLHQMRRAHTEAELFAVCEKFLEHDKAMTLDPLPHCGL
jgi:tRNA-dihydrouridine synthase B